jgi:hypothetical protein
MKSKPISLVNGDSILSSVAFVPMWNYMKVTPGTPATLTIYGIKPTGETAICTCTLNVPTDADSGQICAKAFVVTNLADYSAVCYELNVTSSAKFCALYGVKAIVDVQHIDVLLQSDNVEVMT